MLTLVELCAATHWKIVPPFAQDCGTLESHNEVLARCIGAQVRSIASAIGDGPCDYGLCTTVMPSQVFDEASHRAVLLDGIERDCGRRPVAVLHTYMCAGWGFTLRFFASNLDTKSLLITICDVDWYDLKAHTFHRAIGRQAYGLTTILLRLPPGTGKVITASTPMDKAFPEFVRALRAHCTATTPARIFFPYLREELVRIAEAALGRDKVAPNRASEYSHCFGADSWIGIIEWLQQTPPSGPETVLAGGIAFNGYYTISSIEVSPNTRVDLQIVQGDKRSLERACDTHRVAFSPAMVAHLRQPF